MAGFEGLTPGYIYLLNLVDGDGKPIDMQEFEKEYREDRNFDKLRQVVKPRVTMRATDEFLRDSQPAIGDKVDFVWRNTDTVDNDDRGLSTYLLRARRVD